MENSIKNMPTALLIMWIHVLLIFPFILETSQNSHSNGDPYVDEYYPYQSEGHDQGYMSDWSHDRNVWPSGNQAKCVDIPDNLGLCRGIGYNQMRLPNLLGHDTMSEVTQQAGNWNSLLRINCHPDTQLFLCSLFSPVCLDRPIYPCRKLCEAVKSGCEGRMLHYGFPWPDILDCEQFPLGTDLCIGPQGTNQEGPQRCAACGQPNTFEAMVDNYCRAEFVFKTKIRKEVVDGSEKKLRIGKKKKIFKRGSLKKREVKGIMDIYVNQSEKCDCQLADVNSKDAYYLAMGQRSGSKYYVNAVHLFNKSSLEMKKALRAIRKKNNICAKKGVEVLEVNDDPSISGEKKSRKGGKKRKNRDSAEMADPTTDPVERGDGDAMISKNGDMGDMSPPEVDNNGRGEGGKKGKAKGKKNRDKKGRNGKKRSRNRGNEDEQV